MSSWHFGGVMVTGWPILGRPLRRLCGFDVPWFGGDDATLDLADPQAEHSVVECGILW